MKVILAEKPSVGRDLASFLGARSRREGFYEGGGYQVTWSFGHLVTLKEPQDYDPALKRWSLESLPFVPKRFELKLVGDKGARKQFAVIKRLFAAADELICATDAGREGELIFRYILTMSGVGRRPFQRLWLRSLTHEAIRDAFAALHPGHEYDSLYAAAKCRSEADWIVGLNATRCFTVRYGDGGILWSIGRVQTPVLAMIARRDDQIRNFKPEPFWELLTKHRKVLFKFKGDRFKQEADAQALLEQVTGHELEITKVDRRTERSQPPLLYDLTELQRDMNRRYGLSAADTLSIAQSLYEQKAITYPRTDSRFLSRDMQKKIPGILKSLEKRRPEEIGELDLGNLKFTARIINDRKVSDHHAIIPTGKAGTTLPAGSQRVYDAVVTRLIAVFYPPCTKEVTTVEGRSNRVVFQAKGVRVVDPGWTALYPRPSAPVDRQGGPDQPLPSFTVGQRGPHEPFIRAGETKPPPHFTENALLGAMQTAGAQVDDEQLKDALKERGLGTPATRAAIIETLLKRGYIERNSKLLTATDLGRYLVALIEDPVLKSPEMTGQWEAKLKQIEQRKMDAARFMNEIGQLTSGLIAGGDQTAKDQGGLGNCPRCGREVIEGRRGGYGCSGWREGCGFVVWKQYHGLDLTRDQIRQLIRRRILFEPVTLPERPERREGSERGAAILVMSDQGDVMDIQVPDRRQQRGTAASGRRGVRRGSPGSPGTPAQAKSTNPQTDSPRDASGSVLGQCPLCGQAVVEQTRSFGCSAWQGGCRFAIWKQIAGKRISSRTAQTLLTQGKTPVLKGFKSKAGKSFNAHLKMAGGEVRFEFDR